MINQMEIERASEDLQAIKYYLRATFDIVRHEEMWGLPEKIKYIETTIAAISPYLHRGDTTDISVKEGDAGSEHARTVLSVENNDLRVLDGSNPRISRAPTEEVIGNNDLTRAKGLKGSSCALAASEQLFGLPLNEPWLQGSCFADAKHTWHKPELVDIGGGVKISKATIEILEKTAAESAVEGQSNGPEVDESYIKYINKLLEYIKTAAQTAREAPVAEPPAREGVDCECDEISNGETCLKCGPSPEDRMATRQPSERSEAINLIYDAGYHAGLLTKTSGDIYGRTSSPATEQPVESCRVRKIDREYAERMAISDDYPSVSQSHIHSLAKLAILYMNIVVSIPERESIDWVIEAVKEIASVNPEGTDLIATARALGKATGIARGIVKAFQIEQRRRP